MKRKTLLFITGFYLFILLLLVRNLYQFIFLTALFAFVLLVGYFPKLLKRFFYRIRNRLIVSHILEGIVPVVLLIILSSILVYVMFASFSSSLLVGWLDYKIEELRAGGGMPGSFPLKKGFEGLVIGKNGIYVAVNKQGQRVARIDTVLPGFFREEYGIKVLLPPYIYYREEGDVKVKKINFIRDKAKASEEGDKKKGFSFIVLFEGDVLYLEDKKVYEGAVFTIRATLGSLITGLIKGKSSLTNSLFLAFVFFAILLSFLNLVAMFGGYLIARDITRGLSRLSFAVNAVKRGDLTIRLNPQRSDELGDIMRSFDEMVERMRSLLEKEKEVDLFEQEIKIARKIQLRLMPPEKEEIPGIEHSALTIAARGVGGDFYDIIKGEDWYVIMADVSGKGLHSSLFGAMLKGILTALLKSGLSLGAAIERANYYLYPHLYPSHFITLAALRIRKGEIEMVRAGHQPIIYYKALFEKGVDKLMVLKPEGIGLGIVEDISPYTETIKIETGKGDMFILFTDGLSELPSADGKELFGVERIGKMLRKYHHLGPSEVLDRIVREAESFSNEELPPDDIAIFVGKVK